MTSRHFSHQHTAKLTAPFPPEYHSIRTLLPPGFDMQPSSCIIVNVSTAITGSFFFPFGLPYLCGIRAELPDERWHDSSCLFFNCPRAPGGCRELAGRGRTLVCDITLAVSGVAKEKGSGGKQEKRGPDKETVGRREVERQSFRCREGLEVYIW